MRPVSLASNDCMCPYPPTRCLLDEVSVFFISPKSPSFEHRQFPPHFRGIISYLLIIRARSGVRCLQIRICRVVPNPYTMDTDLRAMDKCVIYHYYLNYSLPCLHISSTIPDHPCTLCRHTCSIDII